MTAEDISRGLHYQAIDVIKTFFPNDHVELWITGSILFGKDKFNDLDLIAVVKDFSDCILFGDIPDISEKLSEVYEMKVDLHIQGHTIFSTLVRDPAELPYYNPITGMYLNKVSGRTAEQLSIAAKEHKVRNRNIYQGTNIV